MPEINVIRAFDAIVDDVNKAKRTIVSKICTGDVDRFNSIISPAGAKLEHYRDNPVVRWEHGKDPRRGTDPIGTNEWITTDGGKVPTYIKAKTRFLDDDFSQQRFEWYRE